MAPARGGWEDWPAVAIQNAPMTDGARKYLRKENARRMGIGPPWPGMHFRPVRARHQSFLYSGPVGGFLVALLRRPGAADPGAGTERAACGRSHTRGRPWGTASASWTNTQDLSAPCSGYNSFFRQVRRRGNMDCDVKSGWHGRRGTTGSIQPFSLAQPAREGLAGSEKGSPESRRAPPRYSSPFTSSSMRWRWWWGASFGIFFSASRAFVRASSFLSSRRSSATRQCQRQAV